MSSSGVMGTVAIIVVSTESKSLIEKKSLTMRPVIAGFFLGLLLFPLDSANPDLSRKFQALLIVSAILLNGKDLLKLVNKTINSAKS